MKKNRRVTKPHDHLFRSMMQDPQVAQEFFEANLPASLKAEVDLSTLKLQKETFIDEDLQEQIADLVFSVQLRGETGYFQLLAEHQSRPKWDMPLRLLKYMIAIQEYHVKHHKTKTLPFVYPLLLYAGDQKYTDTMDYCKLFGQNEERARSLLQTPFQLVDLSQVSEAELDAYKWFGPMAFLMKEIRQLDTYLLAKKLVVKVAKVELSEKTWYIEGMIQYMFEAGETDHLEEMIQLLSKELTSVSEEKIMTIADQLRQEGMQQGAFENSRQIALGMMQKNMPLSIIGELTGLSETDLRQLNPHA